MSNLLTETRNYQNMLEKRRKINEIKENELNKECFDCGSCYPEYISINNGVFICNNCIKIHNKFPKEISLTLKNNLSSLNNKELEFMYLGGNQNLINFIHNYFPELNQFSKDIFYQTKAMQYYRDYLNYLVNSGPEPVLPSKNINAYELVDSNNDLKKKKYERINLGTNYKGVYKNKKRNKSVGNKKGINNNKNLEEKCGHDFTDYVLSYATKGTFEKFGENDIKKMFEKNGVHIYDIKKNLFDKGTYNTIKFKVRDDINGQEALKQKINDIEKNLGKNYNVKIEKEKKKNLKINSKNFCSNPGAKLGILNENIGVYDNAKYTKIPDNIRNKKSFSKQFEQVNYKYKKNNK